MKIIFFSLIEKRWRKKSHFLISLWFHFWLSSHGFSRHHAFLYLVNEMELTSISSCFDFFFFFSHKIFQSTRIFSVMWMEKKTSEMFVKMLNNIAITIPLSPPVECFIECKRILDNRCFSQWHKSENQIPLISKIILYLDFLFSFKHFWIKYFPSEHLNENTYNIYVVQCI